jgi:hypothetical protein
MNYCLVSARVIPILCWAVMGVGIAPLTSVVGADVAVMGAKFDEGTNITYPKSLYAIDITQAPYHAKGDGVTDDTEPLQRALLDLMGQNKMLYFPNGTYLVSKSLKYSNKNSEGKDAWGRVYLQGQNAMKTIIRLMDATFTDPGKPDGIMWCGGFGSADWFHNYIQDMTFDVGMKNPGAIGLMFYSNNMGAVRNCRVIAGEGSGLVGLDLGHRDMNGPLLVSNCEVIGFERGISTALAVNSQTFERITLRGQRQVGFVNAGQAISIRSLLSENSVPAVLSYGAFCLIDGKLTGQPGAAHSPAIINHNAGRIFVRDVTTSGYGRAIGDVETPDSNAAYRITGEDKPGSLGPDVTEYCSHTATNPFKSGTQSLRLKVEETPEVPWDDPSTWAVVDTLGADPTGNQDSSAAIQKAIDSGATTVFIPGFSHLTKPVKVRGKVRRIMGVGAWVDYNHRSKVDFVIEDGESQVVVIEHLAPINGGIEVNTSRTVVFRSMEASSIVFRKKGNVFFEDACTNDLRFNSGQNVWGRQLDIENEGAHITNNGGNLWVLGYKTERGGTLVQTRGGGRSEILGGFSYTTTAGKLAPMFVTENSSIFTFFNEICFNGDPFSVRIKETRGKETKTVGKDDGHTLPYAGHLTKP